MKVVVTSSALLPLRALYAAHSVMGDRGEYADKAIWALVQTLLNNYRPRARRFEGGLVAIFQCRRRNP